MDDSRTIKIMNAANRVEAEQIMQILKANGIECYRRGDIMDIYMGSSNTGEDIMVLESDREAAEILLKDYVPISMETDMENMALPKKQRRLNQLLLAVAIAVVLFGAVAVLLQ